jgi:hypothetical protein
MPSISSEICGKKEENVIDQGRVCSEKKITEIYFSLTISLPRFTLG